MDAIDTYSLRKHAHVAVVFFLLLTKSRLSMQQMISCVNMDRKMIMTDKGGELSNSAEFRKMLRLKIFNLQLTSP